MTSDQEGLVSVIVTTYYRNERLDEALDSVRGQSYSPIEIIVVDGSGHGHARPVIEARDGDVTYIEQETDDGPHAARSIGAERARGAYVQFLDDDDRLRPEKFERQVELLRRRPEVGVVYSGLEKEFGDYRMPNPRVRGDVLADALRFQMSSCYNSTMLIRRECVRRLLPFANRHGADDMGLKIELARHTRFDFVDEPLVVMGEQEYHLGSSWSAIEGRIELLDRYADLYEEHPPTVYRDALAQIWANVGRRTLEDELWSLDAIRSFWRAARLASESATRVKYGVEFLSSAGGRPSYGLAAFAWRVCRRLSLPSGRLLPDVTDGSAGGDVNSR